MKALASSVSLGRDLTERFRPGGMAAAIAWRTTRRCTWRGVLALRQVIEVGRASFGQVQA